jgi:hypothetical protein
MLHRALEVLKEEIKDNSLVFKKCCFPNPDSSMVVNALVVLQKLSISQTTENRKDVIDSRYAQFRATTCSQNFVFAGFARVGQLQKFA